MTPQNLPTFQFEIIYKSACKTFYKTNFAHDFETIPSSAVDISSPDFQGTPSRFIEDYLNQDKSINNAERKRKYSYINEQIRTHLSQKSLSWIKVPDQKRK